MKKVLISPIHLRQFASSVPSVHSGFASQTWLRLSIADPSIQRIKPMKLETLIKFYFTFNEISPYKNNNNGYTKENVLTKYSSLLFILLVVLKRNIL